MQTLAALALLGLASAPHCAAMCGPLAVRGCARALRPHAGLTSQYLLGRATSYFFLGALAGLAGTLVLGATSTTLRAVASEALALLLFIEGLRRWRPQWVAWASSRARRALGFAHPAGLLRTIATPERGLLGLLPRRGLGLGLITGALPCGALYAALALAAASATPLSGALGMLVFSIASAPGLVGAILAAATARRLLRRGGAQRLAASASGAVLIALALWIAVRPSLVTTAHCAHTLEGQTAAAGRSPEQGR